MHRWQVQTIGNESSYTVYFLFSTFWSRTLMRGFWNSVLFSSSNLVPWQEEVLISGDSVSK